MRFSRIFLWLFAFSLLLSGCFRTPFEPNQALEVRGFQFNGIVINENVPFTNELNVTLRVFGYEKQEVYITNDSTCETGGEWIPFVETQKWVLAQLNTQASVYARFRDASTVSECMSDTIIHDNIPPQLGFKVSPGPESHKSSDYFMLEAIDNLSGVSTYYCGDEINHRKCDIRVDVNNLSEGINNFSYFAEDKAGNVAHPIEYQWLVDMTPPMIHWLETPQTLTMINTAHFKFSATDNYTEEPVLECDLNNIGFRPCASPYDMGFLPDGKHKLQLRGRDRAGNITNLFVYEWVVDTTPPAVSIVEAPSRYTNQSISKFRFIAIDAKDQQTFECRIDEGPFTSCLTTENFYLLEGEHRLSVRTRDLAGNVSPHVSHEWGIDLTAPVVEISSHPNPSTNDVKCQICVYGNGYIEWYSVDLLRFRWSDDKMYRPYRL